MICFSNPGEIDIRAVTTLGVNVKEGEHPIGRFGTGVKYAIAGVLRLGGNIEIWSGKECYAFLCVSRDIRGKTFQLVCVVHNDQITELGFTSDLGKEWAPWMYYRELLSNCLDEGGEVQLSPAFSPEDIYNEQGNFEIGEAGKTRIIVICPLIEQAHEEKEKYWLESDSKLIWKTTNIEIHEGESREMFYRGIRATNFGEKGKLWNYTYNILEECSLTEDRVFGSMYEVERILGQNLIACENYDTFAEVFSQNAESGLDYDWPGYKYSEVFREAALEHIKQRKKTPASIRSALKRICERELLSAEKEEVPESYEQMLEHEPTEAPTVTADPYEYRFQADTRMAKLEAGLVYWRTCAEKLGAKLAEFEEKERKYYDGLEASTPPEVSIELNNGIDGEGV